MGEYQEIHSFNRTHTEWYNDRVFSFIRWKEDERLIIVANFDANDSYGFELQLPGDIVEAWNMLDATYTLKDLLGDRTLNLQILNGVAKTRIDIEPLESLILSIGEKSGRTSTPEDKR